MKYTEYSETVPIQYAEGRTRFMGIEIAVDPRVFIPRPETELLVHTAVRLARQFKIEKPVFLDMCTGSAAVSLGLTSEISGASVIGADISRSALNVAKANVAKHANAKKVKLVRSDMFSAFGKKYDNYFDAVISNPPYVSGKDCLKLDAWVKAEPRIALYAGREGMDYLQVIAKESARYIKKGGFLAVEIGYDQADKVKTLFFDAGFSEIKCIKDFNGYERVITGRKNG